MTGRKALIIVLLLAVPACIITTDDDDGQLTVRNDSSFVIEELRVAEVGSRFFGPDLIPGRDALFPGEAISVRLDCDFYDLLFVDEFDLDCVVLDIDVCFFRTVFVIDDFLLDSCAFGSNTSP
jgi:hypothetical protein